MIQVVALSSQGGETTVACLERELRRAIVTLELKPGSRLSEQAVAQRYGVSRQPVREAMIGLARAQLVEVQPQRGTIVAPISVLKLMEARFVREAIEAAVVRQACVSFSPQARARINGNLDRQAEAVERGDSEAFHRCDEHFHVLLAQGTGNRMAWQVIADVKLHMDRVCHLTLKRSSTMRSLVDQHREILTAIDAKDSEAADGAMRLHLSEILKALPMLEEELPEFFGD